MATIQTIKADNDSIIRQQVAVDSINQDEVATRLDVVADEILVRGITGADTTAQMSTFSGANFVRCIVKFNGAFEWLASGTIDGVDVFAASGGGVWSRISSEPGPGGAVALDDITDVDVSTTTPTVGDTIEFDGANWVNSVRLLQPQGMVDFTGVVPPNKLIVAIGVEVVSNLVAFKVGTTLGGDEIVLTAPFLAADSGQVFPVFIQSGPGLTLYFGGITAQTYIKIFLQ